MTNPTDTETDTIRPLREFVAGMTALVGQDLPEGALLPQVRTLMAQLIASDRWLPEAFAQPGQGTYAQHLLHCDPLERFSVVSFVWGPGQRTPVHNHTVWGVVEEGMEHVDNLPKGEPPREPGSIVKASLS